MKKVLKVVGKIFAVLAVVGCILFIVLYKIFSGPSVNGKEKREIKKYVENYLTLKYGDHDFKVTHIEYEYDSDGTLFDYSNPVGYWVDIKSDIVAKSWVTIDGLYPDEYKVHSDYIIQEYHFPDKDGYQTQAAMNNRIPRSDIETDILRELQVEFDSDIYEVECDYIKLNIPEDYGKIPTMEELTSDTSLYKVMGFDFKHSNSIEDKEKYKEKLQKYIKSKYNCDSSIYMYPNGITISVSFEEE